MSALTQAVPRPGRRIAELDPFGLEASLTPSPSYGCVDWYVYGEKEPRADSRAPESQIATAGVPAAPTLQPPITTPRH